MIERCRFPVGLICAFVLLAACKPMPSCNYRFTPKPDLTAHELSRIYMGMNDPRVNPDQAEVAVLARHFTGTPCGMTKGKPP